MTSLTGMDVNEMDEEDLENEEYIDLDDFSSMNDSLGYYVGNKVIKNIASRLKDFLKPDEVLSRYAEDEFVLLIKGQHDHKKITTRAKKMMCAEKTGGFNLVN